MNQKKNPPSNRAQFKQRINEVYRLLLTCQDRQTIIRYAEAKGWNLTDRQVDTYISHANKELERKQERDRDKLYAAAMRRLLHLYSQSYKINDYKTCLAILKEINEISGLHQHTITAELHAPQNEEELQRLREKIDAAISADPTAKERLLAAIPPGADEIGDARV